MQFKQLTTHQLDEELFLAPQHGKESRNMFINKQDGHGHGDILGNFVPKLYDLFSKNLVLCTNYVRYETTIRTDYHFFGQNILGNYKGIREQFVHTDYEKSWAKHCKDNPRLMKKYFHD